jgi:hypothetical protein
VQETVTASVQGQYDDLLDLGGTAGSIGWRAGQVIATIGIPGARSAEAAAAARAAARAEARRAAEATARQTATQAADTIAAKTASEAVGGSRVARVAAHFGKDVIEQGRAVTTPYGSTDIDVVLRDNTFIEVGGPAKAVNLAKFGQQLQRVAWSANEAGGRAIFYYEPGTPQVAIDLAVKWFGEGGARPIP